MCATARNYVYIYIFHAYNREKRGLHIYKDIQKLQQINFFSVTKSLLPLISPPPQINQSGHSKHCFHQDVYRRVGCCCNIALSANNFRFVPPAYNELANTITWHQGGVGKHKNEITIPFLEMVHSYNTSEQLCALLFWSDTSPFYSYSLGWCHTAIFLQTLAQWNTAEQYW